ncbi:MAG: hypothetical protein ACPG77_19820, partial [Nannocystaceae bacterium]
MSLLPGGHVARYRFAKWCRPPPRASHPGTQARKHDTESKLIKQLQAREGIYVQRSPEGRVKSIQPGTEPLKGWKVL